MHTFGETGAGVPAFLAKLWRLVEDPETNQLIYWSRDGRSFIIQNQAQFARELLPLNYKHNNMASFIRQLNMYGFHKITSIDNGGLKFDRDEMEFSHPCFKRGCPYLLEHIKRKIATQKGTIDERAAMKPEAVNKVLNEVKLMRGRQDSLDSRFSVMKQENEALWREIASLRQKHMKQQQIVNKLIQFLVTIVQPSRNMSGVKRHFQLMINDTPQPAKVRKRSESDSGPVIHELTEELLDEVADSDADLLASSPNVLSPGDASSQMDSELADEPSAKSSAGSERPHSNPSVSSQQFDPNNDEDTNYSGSGVVIAKNGLNDIVYHIREIPDGSDDAIDPQFLEENVLTPMVKQEMARSQELQRLQRKNKEQNLPGQSSRKHRGSSIRQQQQQREQQKTPQKQHQQQEIKIPKIKTENDIDPLMFLDVSEDGEGNTLDTDLISSNPNSGGCNTQTDKQMYASGDFISAEMPADLFEFLDTSLQDPSMIDELNLETGSYNPNINLRPTVSGKSLPTPSSSPASGSTAASNSVKISNDGMQSKDDPNNLTLAKYNSQKYQTDEEIMRDEFNSHLENVQEDLDNLKDILRGDGYSLDANTLLGNATSPNRIILSSPLDGDILAKLFADSDILAPYGLSISSENLQDMQKKGSELMTYQPSYYAADLSDILDINSEEMSKTSDQDVSTKSPTPPSSVLNTPYPERD